MQTVSELLASRRRAKRISLRKASRDLLIKIENLEAIERGDWEKLPEPPFTKGFIKNYAKYLGLNSDHILALYRREYDEAKNPSKTYLIERRRRLMLTPNWLATLGFFLAAVAFAAYLIFQYLSVLSSPKLKVYTPADDLTTSVPVVQISGEAEKGATVVIDGEFVPLDAEGNFSYQFKLKEGKNVIEIIASKRLSPKSKVIRVVRLTS